MPIINYMPVSGYQMRNYRIILIALFLFSLIFIYFQGGKVPYMLFYISVFIPLVSLAYTILTYKLFKYSQNIDRTNVIKGEKITLDVNVHNESLLFFPYIKLNFLNANKIFNNQLEEESFSLTPKSGKRASYQLDCKYRGSYAVGVDSILFEDFTGVFKLKYKPGSFFNITVRPRVIHLDKFHIKTGFLSESHSNLSSNYEDFSTVSHIREYKYGDSSKHVHWKASAKLSQLMVKNYQSTSGIYVILVLDTLKNNFAEDENIILEDKVVETLIAVLHYFLSNFINVKLIFYKDDINDIELKTMHDFEKIYDYMSKFEFDSDVDISNILKIYLSKTISRDNIILLTYNINYSIYEQLINARMSGHEPSLIYISPDEIVHNKNVNEDIILSSLNEQNITYYKININDDIKQVLERNS